MAAIFIVKKAKKYCCFNTGANRHQLWRAEHAAFDKELCYVFSQSGRKGNKQKWRNREMEKLQSEDAGVYFYFLF